MRKVEEIHEKYDVTYADMGLLLTVFHDYVGENNVEQDVEALRIAEEILFCKHNIDKISWFDIYDMFIEFNYDVSDPKRGDGEQSLREFFEDDEHNNSHQKNFHEACRAVFESIDNDEYSVGVKADLMYGEEEIDNNASRMKVSEFFSNFGSGLSKEDYEWVVYTIKQWIKMYARKEAHS